MRLSLFPSDSNRDIALDNAVCIGKQRKRR